MAAGSRAEVGNQITSYRVRKVIQSIKEIVGNHSDADIYAVLKESNMDPNETAQKLLNQDPFHEVKRKRDKKKEFTGYMGFSDTRKQVEHNVQPAKSHITLDRNVRRGGFSRNSVPDAGVNREFRVVRDNRVNQTVNRDCKPESVHHSASGKEPVTSSVPEKSNSDSSVSNSEGSFPSQCLNKPCDSTADGPDHVEKTQATTAVLNSQALKEVQDNSIAHSTSTPTSSVVGLYSSSSDPVHVPSPVSRSAGTVGAIRREVGVVGVRRQSLNHPASNSSVSNSSFSVPLLGKHVSSSSESFGQSDATPKSNQLNQATALDPLMSNMSSSRSVSSNQYSSKIHQQPIGHQKAMLSTMEWKPKSSQKLTIISPGVSGTASVPTSSYANNSGSSKPMEVTTVSEKLSQVNILEDRHVIIPQHLRVPESERTQLAFGSFGAGFDSAKGFLSASQAFENAEPSGDGPSASISASVPVSSSGNASADDQGDPSDYQATNSRSDSPASAAESEQPPAVNSESFNHQNIENYADIGLVQSHSPPNSSPHTHQLQTPESVPSFSAYDPQTSYDVPFLRTVMEDNVRGQSLASSAETVQQQQQHQVQQQHQQQVQQQQQPIANLYPQVHISHFPNFMPYRHIFSPVYVPPMAMPNYSSNPAYPHPSNGSSYLLMPGGSSHVTAGGMKYAASQYKPVPAGSPTYGNYTNPTGFTISAPGSVGSATGLEDVTRMKYKDNNLYVPNPQAEPSDIWIQTPRELPNLQSAPYYNLAGQPPHAAAPAFVPAAHAGHASFNAAAAAAAQASHLQYPGLYHPPPSPASAGPHHLHHQSGLGGNIGGVGVTGAAPGPQVGAYQQPQLSHLNWPAKF